jgi:hypothetical protein
VLTKFDAFTWLNHGGDRQKALSEASRDGFGKTLQSRPLKGDKAPAGDVAFLAACLASAIKTGPKSKADIIDITLKVTPGDVLLRVANRERRATGRPMIRGFDGVNAQSLRWACEKVSRQAIRTLVHGGEAVFNEESWVLKGMES